jgi:hypothetical protein
MLPRLVLNSQSSFLHLLTAGIRDLCQTPGLSEFLLSEDFYGKKSFQLLLLEDKQNMQKKKNPKHQNIKPKPINILRIQIKNSVLGLEKVGDL